MSHHDDLIATDILAYLNAQENKSFLRFITCGSVDDGKSTLIGRLLYDSKLIYEDQLASIEKDSKKSGTQGDEIDLAPNVSKALQSMLLTASSPQTNVSLLSPTLRGMSNIHVIWQQARRPQMSLFF